MSDADGGGVQTTVTDALSMHFWADVPSVTESADLEGAGRGAGERRARVERFVSVPDVADQVADKGDGPLSGSCARTVSCIDAPT